MVATDLPMLLLFFEPGGRPRRFAFLAMENLNDWRRRLILWILRVGHAVPHYINTLGRNFVLMQALRVKAVGAAMQPQHGRAGCGDVSLKRMGNGMAIKKPTDAKVSRVKRVIGATTRKPGDLKVKRGKGKLIAVRPQVLKNE